MATKLKNLNRHWATKCMLWLCILSSFLFTVNLLIDRGMNGELDAIFNPDFRSSDVYYSGLNHYYNQVYAAYIDEYTRLVPQYQTALAGVKDRYYMVISNDGNVYTNLKLPESIGKDKQNKIDAFYSDRQIGDVYEINADTSPIFNRDGIFLDKRVHGNEVIYLGMSHTAYQKLSETYKAQWLKNVTPIFEVLGGSLVLILGGMVLLAIGSGRKPNSDDLQPSPLNWFYLDVLLVLWMVVEGILIGVGAGLLNTLGEYFAKSLFLICAGISACMGLWVWQTAWYHLKSKTLLSHTLLAWLWRHTFGRLFHRLSQAFQVIQGGPFYRLPLLIGIGFVLANIVSLLMAIVCIRIAGGIGLIVALILYGTPMAALFVYLIYQDQQIDQTIKGLKQLSSGDLSTPLVLRGTKPFLSLADGVNELSQSLQRAVDQALRSERMKTELITNVSHDLKTPLTAIVSYVDLLKREGLDHPDAPNYLAILEQKSEQLRQLTTDLFDAAKAVSGNYQVALETLHTADFINQMIGEYEDRFNERHIQCLVDLSLAPDTLCADGKHLWRIFDNLLVNAVKYAAPHTRVYIHAYSEFGGTAICIKNTSEKPLNIPASELLERFKRGDESRSTEGSGLGLSIAEGLCHLQGGKLELSIDGDLFKVLVWLPSQCA